ncbi:MAG: hypothetical protein FJX32_14335 [Alphaproteobacteria bacterium]|nr:hypothetical protein [Alphaproteobacteria bacterium]
MRTSLVRTVFLATSLWWLVGSATAASFDCAKARRPIEKLICSNPELDAADTRMGEAFKRVNAGFPLKGFVLATQRVFLAGYSACMNDDTGKTVVAAEAVRRCVAVVRERTAELEALGQAKVYSSAVGTFTPDDLAILVYNADGRQRIRLWGNWMPDAYNPRPFPDGKLCDLDDELKPAKGGFKTASTDDAVLTISETAVQISEYIMCTPRNGIAAQVYRRVR